MAEQNLENSSKIHQDLIQEVIRSHHETIYQFRRVEDQNQTIKDLRDTNMTKSRAYAKLYKAYKVLQKKLTESQEEISTLKEENSDLTARLHHQRIMYERETDLTTHLQEALDELTIRHQGEQQQHHRCHVRMQALEEFLANIDEIDVDSSDDSSQSSSTSGSINIV